MTPLAHRIVKELTVPAKHLTFEDAAGIIKRMRTVHCFECSEVLGLAKELAIAFAADDSPLDAFGGLAFLPAQNTWIEYQDESGRVGYHLECPRGENRAIVSAVSLNSSAPFMLLPLDGHPDRGRAFNTQPRTSFSDTLLSAHGWIIYALLSMINSPRRINQRVIMPHAGLQRRLAAASKTIGKWPLRAHSELTLKVGAPPVDAKDERALVDYLSNQMPLHFVRAHKRRVPDRFGPWTLIPACWRGNAAMGIKQVRYRLATAA